MIKNPERFEKVGDFSEGYAVAKLADGRGYVIIDEEGKISTRIDKFGQEIESILSDSNVIDGSLDNAYFKNGVITFKDKISSSNGITRTTAVTTRTLNATKSGYIFVRETNTEIFGEDIYSGIDERTSEKSERDLLFELFKDPEKFLELKPGVDFKTLDQLNGYADIVNHSMEQSFDSLHRDENVKKAIKFADAVDRRYQNYKKKLPESQRETLGRKIKAFGNKIKALGDE